MNNKIKFLAVTAIMAAAVALSVWGTTAIMGTETLFTNAVASATAGTPVVQQQNTNTGLPAATSVAIHLDPGEGITFYPQCSQTVTNQWPSNYVVGFNFSIDGTNWTTGPMLYYTNQGPTGIGTATGRLVISASSYPHESYVRCDYLASYQTNPVTITMPYAFFR